MEPWVVATTLIFLYLVLALVLGLIANRRSEGDLEDFLLMGRKTENLQSLCARSL